MNAWGVQVCSCLRLDNNRARVIRGNSAKLLNSSSGNLEIKPSIGHTCSLLSSWITAKDATQDSNAEKIRLCLLLPPHERIARGPTTIAVERFHHSHSDAATYLCRPWRRWSNSHQSVDDLLAVVRQPRCQLDIAHVLLFANICGRWFLTRSEMLHLNLPRRV